MKMTASLIQACDYYFGTNSQRALDQIKETLTTGFTGNAATRRGEAYESYVNNILLTNDNFSLSIEQEAFEELRGTLQQEWIKPLTLETKFGTFVFKGRTDYRKPDNSIVFDLKTTKKWDEMSYHMKWQHTIYANAFNAKRFKYIVAVFNDSDSLVPVEIHKVEPIVKSMDSLKLKVEQCVDFLAHVYKEEFEKWAGGKLLLNSGF